MSKSPQQCTFSPSGTPKRDYKCYVVWEGRNPGIYYSWKECSEQVKGFSNNCYKGFHSHEEALAAFKDDSTSRYEASEGPSKRCPNCNITKLELKILEAKVACLSEKHATLSSSRKKSVYDHSEGLSNLSEMLEKKAVLYHPWPLFIVFVFSN